MDLNKLIKEEISSMGKPPKRSSNYLYHSTNIKNLDTISKYGLLPEFGDTLRQTYQDRYDFDNLGHGYDNDPDDGEEGTRKLEFEGIIFLSDNPDIGYSKFDSIGNFSWDECVLCIVVKNDTIFHKISDDQYTDYRNNLIDSVNYIDTNSLPGFIERSDWFSFEEQDCKYILYGGVLKEFIRVNFPNIYTRCEKEHGGLR